MPDLSTVEFAQKIQELPNTFIMTSHINPDGDGLGAMFGLGEAFKALGKEVHYVLDQPVRDYYHMLSEHKHLRFDMPETDGDVVLMTFDCGSKERIGLPEGSSPDDFTLINLDHHLSNDNFGDINILVVDSPASCAMVHEILVAADLEITPTIATSLYMGMVYDTGRFAYSEDPYVFELSGELLRKGADHWGVYTALFRHNDFQQFQVIGELLGRMQEIHGGKLVYLEIPENMTHKINLEETENLINQISNISDLEVVIIFKYLGEKQTKISFRSRGSIDVCELAMTVGGGGHRNASGAVMEHDFETSRDQVLSNAAEMLRQIGYHA